MAQIFSKYIQQIAEDETPESLLYKGNELVSTWQWGFEAGMEKAFDILPEQLNLGDDIRKLLQKGVTESQTFRSVYMYTQNVSQNIEND